VCEISRVNYIHWVIVVSPLIQDQSHWIWCFWYDLNVFIGFIWCDDGVSDEYETRDVWIRSWYVIYDVVWLLTEDVENYLWKVRGRDIYPSLERKGVPAFIHKLYICCCKTKNAKCCHICIVLRVNLIQVNLIHCRSKGARWVQSLKFH
jgi:hypothetical protein